MSTEITKGQLALMRATEFAGGHSYIAESTGVSYQAVQKWAKNGLPRTEWTGETNYAEAISSCVDSKVTKEQLLDRSWATSKQIEVARKKKEKKK